MDALGRCNFCPRGRGRSGVQASLTYGDTMKRALAIALLALSAPASATLFCYNGDTGTGMEWNAGVFIYTNQNVSPPVVIKNPGPVLETDAFTFAYCWANGPELTYLVTNLPDLRYPEVTTSHSGGTTIRKSLQHPDGTVYWTGQEAIWLMNNL